MKQTNFKSKFLILLIFMGVVVSGYYLLGDIQRYSWENLKNVYLILVDVEKNHPVLTPILFMSIYILYTLLSLPGIFLFSLIAGCLFIQPLSTLYVTIAATIGATLFFLLARTAFGKFFYGNTNQFMNKMELGFRKNAASYLLFLRLIPLSPFWIINISGAFFKVPFWTFIWTTFVGMIPSVFIYTQAGKELALLLYNPHPLNPVTLFNPYLIFTLVLIALMALIPVFLNRSWIGFRQFFSKKP